MSYKAEILADSINPQGDRITTMKITFPRIMLSEFNTHRMFSRNSASSRAIPFKKMVKMVEDNPFIPLAFQRNHKGMQGNEYLDELGNKFARSTWLTGRDWAIKTAQALNSTDNGYDSVTKQLCNRLLEPFMWHTVIVTATEWENFFELRCPVYTQVSDKLDGTSVTIFKSKKDYEHCYGKQKFTALEWLKINKSQADIHIQAIAELMWDAMNESTPKQLQSGEWHIPFGDNMDLHSVSDKSPLEKLSKKVNNTRMAYSEDIEKLAIKIATARCARISYETLGDNPKIDYEADIRLHDMLAESSHWSPFEHCAKAMSNEEYDSFFNGRTYVNQNEPNYKELNKKYSENGKGWCRNFKGFIQYRHLIDNN